jgi:hypothetical protein
MKILHRRLLSAIAVLLLLFIQPLQANPDQDNLWLIGTWELKLDPDNMPTDWLEFRPDGTFVGTQLNCNKASGRYHLYEGDIFFAIEPNGKFLANGMRPNLEKNKLLYTSPRSRNTSVYEKVQHIGCING